MTLAQSLDPARFESVVLCLRQRGAFASQLEGSGVPIHVLPGTDGRPDYLAFRRVARFMREWKPDVVHTHNTAAFIDGGLGAVMSRTPVLVHTDHARSFPDKLRYMVAERVMSTAADWVVGVSDHTVRNLRRYEWIPRRKLVTVTNGIDGDRYTAPVDAAAKRRELGIRPDAPVLGFAARLTEQKGLTYLLRAMAMLVNEFPTLTLLVAGDGPLRGDLEREAASLGLDGNVRFLGVRHDVPELLQTFDVCVLPSLWEGLPMVVLEAMASGCPLVATLVGGVSTAIRHGETGMLVEAGDISSLASALRAVLTDGALRARLAENGRRAFQMRFTARAMARQYESLYLKALGKRGR